MSEKEGTDHRDRKVAEFQLACLYASNTNKVAFAVEGDLPRLLDSFVRARREAQRLRYIFCERNGVRCTTAAW